MGALNALCERAKAKLAADEGLEQAQYVIPIVCERARRESVHPGDVSFLVYELLELTVRRRIEGSPASTPSTANAANAASGGGEGDKGAFVAEVSMRHLPHTRVTLDVDLAPLVAAAREELSPPAWDGPGDVPSYHEDTRKRIEARARALIADVADPPQPAT